MVIDIYFQILYKITLNLRKLNIVIFFGWLQANRVKRIIEDMVMNDKVMIQNRIWLDLSMTIKLGLR